MFTHRFSMYTLITSCLFQQHLAFSGSLGTQWLLFNFFSQSTERFGLLFWAPVPSAQTIIKMFSQRRKSKRLVKNTGHPRVDRTAMITAPQNSIKSTKRTQKRTIRSFRRLMRRHVHVDTLKNVYLQATLSDWRHAGVFSCWRTAQIDHKGENATWIEKCSVVRRGQEIHCPLIHL